MSHSFNTKKFNIQDKELFRLNRKESDKYGSLNLDNLFFETKTGLQDDSKVAFVCDEKNESFAVALNLKSTKTKTLKLYSFTKNLEKKLEHIYTRATKDDDFDFKNIDVTDDGNIIYLLAATHLPQNKNKWFTYELSRISKDGEVSANIENESPFSETLKTLYSNNSLILAGFYSENGKSPCGISYFKIDPSSLKPLKIKHTPFPAGVALEKKKESRYAGIIKSDKNFIFNKIIEAGTDLIINAEEFWISSNNNQPVYCYGDILAARINAQGDVIWFKNINKYQSTMYNTSYYSYTPVFKDDVTCFFINMAEDVKKKTDGTIHFTSTGINKVDFAVIKIDSKGKLNYMKLLDNKEEALPVITAYGLYTNDAAFFLGKKGKEKQLIKVNL